MTSPASRRHRRAPGSAGGRSAVPGHRRLASAATVGVVALLLTGCGALRDGAVRPSVNDCVASIPVGQALVGERAELVKLRRLSLPQTQALLTRLGSPRLTRADAPRPVDDEKRPSPSPTSVPTARPSGAPGGPRPCVLVFSGTFSGSTLAAAPGISGAATGGYVVLVTTTRHPRVLRTVIATADPIK